MNLTNQSVYVKQAKKPRRTKSQEEIDDAAYLEWLKHQPSCISGRFSESHSSGEQFSIPCHVRRASHAGTGFKPRLSAIPLTKEEHDDQHQHGEIYVMKKYLKVYWDLDICKQWFNDKAQEYLDMWRKSLNQ